MQEHKTHSRVKISPLKWPLKSPISEVACVQI